MIPVFTVIFLLISAVNTYSPESQPGSGYRDIVVAGSRFLAAGTNGRMDYYEAAGSAASFLLPYKNDISSLITIDNMILAAGSDGLFLVSKEGGEFKMSRTGISEDINGMTLFKNVLVAGANEGTILVSTDGVSFGLVRPGVRGNILSIGSNDAFCIAVTDEGEILKSEDGLDWKVTDFNKEYRGYYQECRFKKVMVTEDRIIVAGTHSDGSPAVFFSSSGSVWNERTLNYEDERGEFNMLEAGVNDIAWDNERNVFLLACDNGLIMLLPSCSKCNELFRVSENDIHAICITGKRIVVAGENFFIKDLALDLN